MQIGSATMRERRMGCTIEIEKGSCAPFQVTFNDPLQERNQSPFLSKFERAYQLNQSLFPSKRQ